MKTINHAERQTWRRYDDTRHLLYLNERPVTYIPESLHRKNDPTPEPIEGFAYAGEMADGSTRIEAAQVTDDNRRDKFIAGLIGVRYSLDAQIAILANGTDSETHARELVEFNDYRAACKRQVDELLSRGE